MNRNSFKNIFLIILFLLFFVPTVNAQKISKDDVTNSTYVIGKYMFTRNASNNYDGKLTTRRIMLASKTIAGNTETDMIIYYKNVRGNWVDGLTGAAIETPDEFDIEVADLDNNLNVEIPNLNSLSYLDEDVNSSTYVIGKYIFTRNASNNYDGKLTTKRIMLASKTITGNTEADMIIYYKNARGNWVDGLTGAAIEIPSEFDISFLNLEKVNGQFYGDVNEDGLVDDDDATELSRYVGWNELSDYERPELSAQALENADINNDGKINKVDEILLSRYVIGMYENTLPNRHITNYVIFGDLNEDGLIDADDATKLSRYLGWTEESEFEKPELSEQALKNADVNSDGKIDKVDQTLLLRYTVGWYENTLPNNPIINYVLYGDANEDGESDPRDLIRLSKYLEWTEESDFERPELSAQALKNADVNNDSKVDKVDSILLAQYTIGWYKNTLPNTPIIDYVLYGDVNEDGLVDDEDATELSRYVGWNELSDYERPELSEQALENADINNDGKINKVDEILLSRYVIGMYENTLPNAPITNYVLYGDLDENGIINGKDDMILIQYLEWTEESEFEKPELSTQALKNADINNDGKVDKVDQILLERYTAGWYENTLPNAPITNYVILGDVNEDGLVDDRDVLKLSKYLEWTEESDYERPELSAQALKNADIDENGQVNEADLTALNNLVNTKVAMSAYEFPTEKNVTETRELNLLIIEINPTLYSISDSDYSYNNNHPKAADLLHGLNSEVVAINEMLEDIEETSYGYLDIKTTWEYLDEFPTYTAEFTLKNGETSHRLDEETYLSEIKYDGTGKTNSSYWWNLLSGDYWSQIIPAYSFDYEYIISKFNLVERKNNNEFDMVWFITIDPAQTYETNMVGRNAYWINGAPIIKDCDNFILANVSISRRDANYHAFGHGIEGILYNVFGVPYGADYQENYYNISNEEEYNELNLLQKFFLGTHNNTSSYITGVGNVHFPFNGTSDYDYSNSSSVNSNWKEWLNYPNIRANTTSENSTSWHDIAINQHILNNENEEHDNDRLYTRFWTSLFPHVTGYTSDGYSNNWWEYIANYDYVVNLGSSNQVFNVGNQLNIEINVEYYSNKQVTKTISKYEKNMHFADESLFEVDRNGNIYAKESGSTSLTYYLDGKSVTIPITIN